MRVERKIFKIVEDNGIRGFADLVDYTVRNDLHAEFEEIYENPEFYSHYLKSRYIHSDDCLNRVRELLSQKPNS